MNKKIIKVRILILLFLIGVIGYGEPNYASNSNWEIDIDDDELTYNGKVKTPNVYVYVKGSLYNELHGYTETDVNRVADDSEEELENDLFKVTYPKGRKNVGKYKITVTLKNGLKDTINFKILPKESSIKKLTSTNDSITVKWSKIKNQATGYQIKYSTKSSLKSGKTVTIKKNSKTSKKIKDLKEGKKYYFAIRTYKTVSGKKYYSDWSSTKKCKTTSSQSTSSAKTPDKSSDSSDEGDSDMVWVSGSGKKYHSKSTCSGMKNPRQISIADAKKRGYTPCKKCY